MSKTLLRVFPFFSALLLLSLFSLLSSLALATSELPLEETLEWIRETPKPSAPISWQILISFDTFLIFCALVWILYTYCCPQKVLRFWKKLFVFFSISNKESNLETCRFAENHLGASKPDKKKGEKKPFRWMRLEEIK